MAENPGDAEIGKELRLQILNSSAAEVAIEPSEAMPRVWGVVVDWPVSEQIATVASLADGNASLYTTSTFGVIGGGEHERVRAAARRVVEAAEAHLEMTTAAQAFPYPGADQVFFYFLTFQGVRAATAEAEGIEAGTDELTGLFGLTQKVLTELRLSRDRGAGDPAGDGAREWFGIPGYLNCLLTGMSRGMGESIDIAASAPLPNLDHLSAGNADLHEWIAAQQFDYDELAALELITLLKESVRFRGLPFSTRKGEIKTIHAQEDGTGRARVFDLELARGDKSVRITLAGNDDPRVVGLQFRADQRSGGRD